MCQNKQMGSSLTGVLMAAGIIGGLAVMTLRLTNMQLRSTKITELNVEINESMNHAKTVLLSKEACENTLGVTKVSDNNYTGIHTLSSGSAAIEITQLKDRRNKKIVLDSNRGLKLDKIYLKNVDNLAANAFGIVELEFHFQKTSKVVSGSGKVTKAVNIQVKTDADGKIVECFSATENAVTTAYNTLCKDLGGVINSSGKCEIKTFTLKSQSLSNPCIEGSMYYNSSAQMFYYCTASGWSELRGPKGDKGDKGDKGEKGDPGAAGTPGEAPEPTDPCKVITPNIIGWCNSRYANSDGTIPIQEKANSICASQGYSTASWVDASWVKHTCSNCCSNNTNENRWDKVDFYKIKCCN
ncbi:MAG: hypothetical protein ISR65_04480 [Bacteriovoracaceae bacterium]|nr:hypothetical protein [Bacteriovoracaceae bacterium]